MLSSLTYWGTSSGLNVVQGIQSVGVTGVPWVVSLPMPTHSGG